MHAERQKTLAKSWRNRSWFVAGLTAVSLLLGGAPASAHGADGHPARIHAGSCEQLGAAEFPLVGVGATIDLDDAPLARPETVNPETTEPVMVSETTIDMPLEEIVGGEYAVMVYESDEAMDGVACGNIGGVMMGDSLITALGELGDAGSSGFAMLRPEGDSTVVTILLGSGPEAEAEEGHDESAAEGHDEPTDEGAPDTAATPAA